MIATLHIGFVLTFFHLYEFHGKYGILLAIVLALVNTSFLFCTYSLYFHIKRNILRLNFEQNQIQASTSGSQEKQYNQKGNETQVA